MIGRHDGARAVITAAVLVLTLAACGSLRPGPGAQEPPPLAIGSVGGLPVSDAASGTSGGYVLAGDLPSGPASAGVLRYGTRAADEGTARSLAAALGMAGVPERRSHGWELAGAGGLLRVRDDGEWSFSREGLPCPRYAVDVTSADGGGGVACADAGDTATLRPVGRDAPTDPEGAAVAVLLAAGIGDQPRVLGPGGTATVTVVVDPVVAGLPTSGVRTVVDVDADGVLGALGRTGTPTAGEDYPILSARDTLDRLTALPVPLPACPETVGDDGSDPCPQPSPVTITGARLGLALAFDAGRPTLVPAWLYDVEAAEEPIAVVAVQDAYLTEPGTGVEPTDGAGAGSAPGAGGGTDTPVAPPSDPGLSPEPLPGSEEVSAPVESVRADGRTLTVIGWGGVCADYRAVAEEFAGTVEVRLVGRATTDRACIEIAVRLELETTLTAPLGDRVVVDAGTGEPVPVER